MNSTINAKLKIIRWKDFTTLNSSEKFTENTVNFLWLFSLLILAWYELYLFVLPCSFMFFLTPIRQSHNGYLYYTLGTSK